MFGEMRGLAVGLGIFWILVFITNNDVIRGGLDEGYEYLVGTSSYFKITPNFQCLNPPIIKVI
jgi:hypothetical protein